MISKPIATVCVRTFAGRWHGKPFNRLDITKRNMQSLFENTKIPHNIIVVDDCSTVQEHNDYLDMLEARRHITKLVRKSRHKGRQHSFALQRHWGYVLDTPYVYICDDDYEYSPGWLGELIHAYEILEGHWKEIKPDTPIGVLSGFNREGRTYPETHTFDEMSFGLWESWIGCRWLMTRKMIDAAGGYDQRAPTKDWPKQWTSPWIDDGSYQLELTSEYGYEHSFVYLKRPTLIDHIGTFGVHAQPNKYVRGVK